MDSVHISPGKQILRKAALPTKGTLLVGIGESVDQGTRVAETVLPERYQVFDVANNLRLPLEKVDRHIQRLSRETFKKGDVIAQKNGLISRLFRAKADGKVLSIREGKIVLALGEKRVGVSANYPGTVVELLPDQGAIIATYAAIVQGEWGNGLYARGELVLEPELPGQNGGPPAQYAGRICYFASCPDVYTLRRILRQSPSGLIVGCILPNQLKQFQKLDMPVMSLLGIGDYNVDNFSRDVLGMMEGHEVYLNAQRFDCASSSRPEVIQPVVPETDQADLLACNPSELCVGSLVRLLGKPYTGSVGFVVELPVLPERLASGLLTRVAVVERQDGQIVRLPAANLELII